MKRILLTIITLCAALSAGAQNLVPLTLADFRLMVVDSSNNLRISEAETSASESKFKMTRTDFYPSLTAGAGANYFIGNPAGAGVSLKNYTYNANLTLQQNIYAGHSVASRTKAAAIELDIARITQDQTLENVVYSSDLTYWALAASDKQLGVMRDYVDIVRNLFTIVSERFNNGYISRTDLLMVETRLNEAHLQELSARKLRDNSLQNLNTLLNNITLTNFTTVDSLSAPTEMPEFRTLDDALTARPDYHIATRAIDLQNQNIKVARSKYNPQLVAGVQGVFGTNNPNLTGQNVGYGVVFVNFTAPIFHFNERRHSVAMARSAVRVAELKASSTRDLINQELANAEINIRQTFEQTQIAENNLEIAQENLDLNTYSYAEGRLPILDVLSAQLAWIQSYTAAVNANYQYRIAMADYARALGVISEEIEYR